MFLQQVVNGLILGSEYALFAIGLTLLFGTLRIVNFAHGAVFMWGAFFALAASRLLGIPVWIIAVPAGIIGAAALTVAMEIFMFKPLRRPDLDHLAPAIASIGLSTALVGVSEVIFGAEAVPVQGIPVQLLNLGSVSITMVQLIIVGLALLLMVALQWMIDRSRIGRQIRAVAYSEPIASSVGVNVPRVIYGTFLLGGAAAGAAGAFMALLLNLISPYMAEGIIVKGFSMIVLGGIGSTRGAMLGGLILGFTEVMAVGYISTGYRDAMAFGLLFMVLLLRPTGLMGKVEEVRA